MNKKKLILIGGGGHAKVVISQLKKLPNFEIIGLIDEFKPQGGLINGFEIIGSDKDLKKFHKKGFQYALITIGSIKDNSKRHLLFEKTKEIGFRFPVVISQSAVVDDSVKIGEGTIIMPGCIINVDSFIGKNCIINTSAIIEHHCKIGNHCHIAPGVNISGGTEIGDLSFIGAGSTIIQGIKIGKNVTVGAGSTIINDVQSNMTIAGNPAVEIRKK